MLVVDSPRLMYCFGAMTWIMSRDFMCALFYVLFEIDWYCYVRWEHNYQNYNRNWDEVGPLCSRTIYRLRPIWQRNPDEDGKKFKFLYKHDKMVIFWFPLYVLHRVIVNRIYVSRKINTLKKKQISAKNIQVGYHIFDVLLWNECI